MMPWGVFLILKGIPDGEGSKRLKTNSKKLRPIVSLPRKVADQFLKSGEDASVVHAFLY